MRLTTGVRSVAAFAFLPRMADRRAFRRIRGSRGGGRRSAATSAPRGGMSAVATAMPPVQDAARRDSCCHRLSSLAGFGRRGRPVGAPSSQPRFKPHDAMRQSGPVCFQPSCERPAALSKHGLLRLVVCAANGTGVAWGLPAGSRAVNRPPETGIRFGAASRDACYRRTWLPPNKESVRANALRCYGLGPGRRNRGPCPCPGPPLPRPAPRRRGFNCGSTPSARLRAG